ncbi:MAG: YbaB/EbfC family DNA-binding protein [Actinophytocola sp.]|uniref:YbaB/EbfC family nucleoid-associated protein n=1 Tax=Actinophytocola sp. TaxID=1872138 RepID=UPI001321461C|nr:YbaB/EbfC family nucleoid-associated protein [Actinophytocola sp.]MPZ83007.1 YbaB/EbfC family DNA-binding protein [Actinophytocola sp.]
MAVTPEEWLASFNAKIDDIKAKTAEFQENLEASGVTETSPDGSVSVSVAPNGSLTDLRIEESAWRGSGGELAGKIMQLARKAQRSAAVNVAEAFAPLGVDSEAMHMVTGYIPEPEAADAEEETDYAFNEEPEAAEQPPPRPATDWSRTEPPRIEPPRMEPPPRPARPPRRKDHAEDDDFGDEQIFGRDDR